MVEPEGELSRVPAERAEQSAKSLPVAYDCTMSPTTHPAAHSQNRTWRFLAVVLIPLAFLPSVWTGLTAGFDADDVMNLHEAVERTTLQQLVIGLVYPFTPLNRPTGQLYYRMGYLLFGWRPLAFRLVTDTFMAANVVLVYLIAQNLATSAEAGLLAAILFAFHGRLSQLYMSNGTVYDVLCTFFSLIALKYYIDTRTRYGAIGWRKWAMLIVILIAALNAKEIAAVLPGLFLIFDWTCRTPERGFTKRVRWMLANSWPSMALLAGVAVALWGKTRVGGPFLNPAYKVTVSVASFFFTGRFYFSELFYLRPHALVGRHIVFLFILLFAIAALIRRKPVWFLIWFATLAPLPILFIPPRGFYVMYLPLAGWAMFVAMISMAARDRLLDRSFFPQYARFVPLILCVLAVGYGLRDADFRASVSAASPTSEFIERSKQDFLRLNEPLPKGASVLLLGSRVPAEANPYLPWMIIQLLYGDRSLQVDRAELMNPPPGAATFAEYDRVIRFDGTRLNVLKRSASSNRPTRLPSSAADWRG